MHPMQKLRARTSLYIYLSVLGLFFSGCTRTPLEQKLVSADDHVRNIALEKLSQLSLEKQKTLAPKIALYLKNEDSLVVSRAGTALAIIGEPAMDTLIAWLTDPDIFARLTAIDALGDIGPSAKAATPNLTAALKDPHPLVREEAAYALKKISPSPGRS